MRNLHKYMKEGYNLHNKYNIKFTNKTVAIYETSNFENK